MQRLLVLGIVAVLFASSASCQDSKKAATPKAESEALKPEKFGIVGGFGLLTQKSVQQDLNR